jgi:hypothetical protein
MRLPATGGAASIEARRRVAACGDAPAATVGMTMPIVTARTTCV